MKKEFYVSQAKYAEDNLRPFNCTVEIIRVLKRLNKTVTKSIFFKYYGLVNFIPVGQGSPSSTVPFRQ